jgi:hypothetical protein
MPYAALTRRLRTSRCLQAVVTMAAVSFMCFFDDRDLDILCNPAPIMGALGELRRGTFPGHGQLDPNMRMKSLDDCFQRLSDSDCEANYRFAKHELSQLYDSLGFPAEVRLGGTANWNGMLFYKSELLLVTLRRLAYPNRWIDLQTMFGLSPAQMSVVFEYAVRFLTARYEPMLRSPCIWSDHIQGWAEAVFQKAGRFDSVFGFIDGTVRQICRPGPRHVRGAHGRVDIQRLFYSGHKRKHALKFQTMVAPCGIIMHLFGPFPGRGNDGRMLRESGLMADLTRLRTIMNAAGVLVDYYVYGDAAYPVSPYMMRSLHGIGLTAVDRAVNTDMSNVRISVEWQYGELLSLFAFLDFSQNLKLHLQPLHHYYVAGVLLLNCRICMRQLQHKTPRYFNCAPPAFVDYVGMHNDARI